jgi:hypothetical protein
MTRTTNTEIAEKVARIEERGANMAADIDEMKTDIKDIKDFMYTLDKRFVTRAELTFFKWIVGVVATIVGLVFIITDHWK